jgi:hypothetical protein
MDQARLPPHVTGGAWPGWAGRQAVLASAGAPANTSAAVPPAMASAASLILICIVFPSLG